MKRYKIKIDRQSPNYFANQQVDLILYKSRNNYLHDMILLDVYTGLRQTELAFLEWKDINFNTWTVTVQAKDEFSDHTQPILLPGARGQVHVSG